MAETRYSAGSVLLAALLGIVIGAVGGFYVKFWTYRDAAPSLPPGGAPAMQPMRGPGGPAVTGAGMRPALTLVRTVRGLAAMQSVQGKGLTKDQARTLLPFVEKLRRTEKLDPADAEQTLAGITAVLTDAQKEAVRRLDLRPGRPAGGAPRLTRRPTTPLVSGLAQAGGAGGGPAMDTTNPERPFESPENQELLHELESALRTLNR